VAAPIFGFDGRVAGGVSVTAPAFRCGEAAIEELAPAVIEAARETSANLGSVESGSPTHGEASAAGSLTPP